MSKTRILLVIAIVLLAVVVIVLSLQKFSVSEKSQLQSLSRVDTTSTGSVISISNSKLKLGEIFVISATMNGAAAQKVVIKIDGAVAQTCEEAVKECVLNVGPFEKKDIGKHTYAVDITTARGAVESYAGEFTVSAETADAQFVEGTSGAGAIPPKNIPAVSPPTVPATPITPVVIKMEVDKIMTSGEPTEVGQVFSTTLYMKYVAPIERIVGFVDGNKFKTCENTYVCGLVLGPMNYADIGKHVYRFDITAKSGESMSVSGTFTVQALASPVQPLAPVDAIAPTVQIVASQSTAFANTTVSFKATADDSSGIKKIAIAFGNQIVKECFGVKECNYVAGPFSGITQEIKYIFGATAIDIVGNSFSTAAQYLTVKPAAQIVEPTVSFDTPDEAIQESKSTTFTMIVSPGSKQLDYVNCVVAGQVVKTCSGNCSVNLGPFTPWAGTVIKYYAKAYFTDGTTKLSAEKSLSIVDEILPTINVNFSPNQRSMYAYEQAQIASFVDAQGLEIFSHDIYVNDVVKKSCTQSICVYGDRADIMLGFQPKINAKMTFYSKVSLSNGQTVTSATGSITVKPGQAAQ
ncbi:hypothetical protein A2482_03975 [Candidatus Falkowbacteria bacterium RIFOXYC2_FULL_48_21]|uniref:Uncharacterized protein n=1 Tax=Candidatus Falkowbacteria bacterium RIFOXYC2_FULL_48_21 TaxID=1798005 RepID=A0A1F5TH05_9BACT|nr:MAG: hypothetical protein A2482_03975 [Candidatus Falkowbacteria bacterium RIFOXYC2_FULL_48_21]